MKCLFLAAGYATRLYPLTENFPKPLLKVKDKPILDWLIDDLESESGLVDEYVVVTNDKFAEHFEKWTTSRRERILVVNDGARTNETRLGAVKDAQLAIEEAKIDDDLLVVAGDNLLDFSLTRFVEYSRRKSASCVMRYYEPELAKLRKRGVADVDADGRVTAMIEKPAEPKSHWCVPPFYYYKREDVKLVKKGIESGCGVDAPGSLIAWLCAQTPVYAYEMPGKRYDIGDLASYENVQKEWGGVKSE